jgi:hypothetical protein
MRFTIVASSSFGGVDDLRCMGNAESALELLVLHGLMSQLALV